MFTGIISHLGNVHARHEHGIEIAVPDDLKTSLKNSGSISVNGVCLTVTSVTAYGFTADIMPETWKRTALGTLSPSDKVNLELPMSISDRFEGHIVQGHVDGIGSIHSITPDAQSHLIQISIDPSLSLYCVPKGSIALNGISLTLISVSETMIKVGIIPYTWTHTMLHTASPGTQVNIEIDILAKHIHHLYEKTIPVFRPHRRSAPAV